jgi:hypothetical protein
MFGLISPGVAPPGYVHVNLPSRYRLGKEGRAMAYVYRFKRNDSEENVTIAELAQALQSSFAHLDSSLAMPIGITNEDGLYTIDLAAILDAWRQQPELQMAVLAEAYALDIENIKEDYEQKLRLLSETFRRDLAKLASERDRRRAAYTSVAQG